MQNFPVKEKADSIIMDSLAITDIKPLPFLKIIIYQYIPKLYKLSILLATAILSTMLIIKVTFMTILIHFDHWVDHQIDIMIILIIKVAF